MRKPDPLVDIEVAIRGDTAAALGRAGRSLGRAVEALVEFDKGGLPGSGDRKALLHAAAQALWGYVVQKEAIGVTDHARAIQIYGITPEMWRLMGAAFRDDPGAS